MAGGQEEARATDANDAHRAEELRELVDRMEEEITAEHRDRGERGNIDERRTVAPVDPDDQAPD